MLYWELFLGMCNLHNKTFFFWAVPMARGHDHWNSCALQSPMLVLANSLRSSTSTWLFEISKFGIINHHFECERCLLNRRVARIFSWGRILHCCMDNTTKIDLYYAQAQLTLRNNTVPIYMAYSPFGEFMLYTNTLARTQGGREGGREVLDQFIVAWAAWFHTRPTTPFLPWEIPGYGRVISIVNINRAWKMGLVRNSLSH